MPCRKSCVRAAALLGLVVALALALRGSRAPIRAGQPPDDERPAPPTQIVKQGFPAGKFDPAHPELSDSAWEIEWELTHPRNQPPAPPGSMLRIKSAKFMFKDRAGKPQWITMVRMLELAEIYVPYDDGFTAFLDIHDMPFFITPARKEFLGPNCAAPGEILGSVNPYWANTVHKEVHDDGIRWMSAEGYRQVMDRARRGEKMILWSTYFGANYRYLIEYGFGDDGMITCRIGPTGRNIFNRQPDLKDTHLHIGCWRFEPDLGDPAGGKGGPKDNEIQVARRVLDEQADRFSQVVKPFAKNGLGQPCEGSAKWVPEEFTTVRVVSKVRKNVHNRPIGFDVIPLRYGAVRQLQPEGGSFESNLEFINNDFWVTRTESGFTSYVDVPQYASQRRSLVGQPTTVWLCTPALHAARGEDFGNDTGVNSYGGVAITTWASFMLKPRDLFDGTPLYVPRQMPPRMFRPDAQ